MLNDKIILSLLFLIKIHFLQSNALIEAAVAPILDIENETMGYVGSIGERNILVDLKPHLQIKNIDEINGICSYHVFKPNSEEFPFMIDIKDKTTGEAVIQVVRKELESKTSSTTKSTSHIFDTKLDDQDTDIQKLSISPTKSILLDCNKRKEFNFLIQVHDCSVPSISSKKIPVKIEVMDHDDYSLSFDKDLYKKTLIKSNDLYDNFMQVIARDEDCTNNGQACSYKLLKYDLTEVESDFAFKIDQTGQLSTTRPMNKGELFEFNVRAFDCISKDSFVDVKVIIDVIEECVPQWDEFSQDINSLQENTNLFESIKATTCDLQYQEAYLKPDMKCDIDLVRSKITFDLDPKIKNTCAPSDDNIKCDNNNLLIDDSIVTTSTRTVLFSVNESKINNIDEMDDDTIEDDDDENNNNNNNINSAETLDENIIQPLASLKKPETSSKQMLPPINYRSFSKVTENAQNINFDGKFGDEFTLSVWLRRPANADKTIKEQVICGTDSHEMNRHHFGIYFYRGNFKFLLRKEPSGDSKSTPDTFYPSLWEWSLYEPLLSDAKWHFYEIKFSYPNASLYVDGVKFIENSSNSDIIDAYELNDVKESGPVTAYIGACYHSRSSTLLDHFEGDIADLVLTKKQKNLEKLAELKKQKEIKCKQQMESCNEYIEMNMVGNENYLQSIESSNQFDISVKTSNLNDMSQLIRKLNYINKNAYLKQGSRAVRLSTTIRCGNTGRQLQMKELSINLNVKRQQQEYNVQLEGVKQIFAKKFELESGIEPFKDISILKIPINKIDDSSSLNSQDLLIKNDNDDSSSSEENSDENNVDQNQPVQLSKCLIKILPKRNLMAPTFNSEKIMFLQNLLDDFDFKFEETLNSVTISGVQSVENYETFIRRLTYLITNINEVDPANLNLIKNKQFYITCFRSEPNIETNTILIQLNLTREEQEKLNLDDNKNPEGFIAHKQIQKLLISDLDDIEVLKRKVSSDDSYKAASSSNRALSPILIAVIVLCSCVIGFVLVFGVIKMHTSRFFTGKRKQLPNEENPQMEWDDSGLNITENPLDNLKVNKELFDEDDIHHHNHNHQLSELDGDEYSSSEDEEEEDEDESNEEEEAYSSGEEQPEKTVTKELEWDDTSLEIKVKDKQLQLQKLEQQQQLLKNINNNLSNKMTSPPPTPSNFNNHV